MIFLLLLFFEEFLLKQDGTRLAARCFCCGEVAHYDCMTEEKRNTLNFWGAFFCNQKQKSFQSKRADLFKFIEVKEEFWVFFVRNWQTAAGLSNAAPQVDV